MSKEAPNSWYEMVTATTDSLPWRTTAQGVLVLGDDFTTAPREAVTAAPSAGAPWPTAAELALPVGAATLQSAEQQYGELVHAALQGLPVMGPEAARAQAEADGVRAALPWLFGPGSRAEAELVLPGGALGRLDRLVPPHATGQGAWWIIDFKTGTPQATVPAGYVAQLQGYGMALIASLPVGTKIKLAVVWTATATLAEVPFNG